MENALDKGAKPLSVDELHLPSTSFDELTPMGPRFLYHLISKVLGFNLQKFSLPEGLTGKNKIPSYALHEFHNLPNGYYSTYFAKGYSVGFNFFMLGQMGRIRKSMAQELSGCTRVLDLGCGDGTSTKILCEEGIKEVWGLDPSPYLLAHAIERTPAAKFVHAIAEKTEFKNQSFDGVSACWVLHEIPAQVCHAILDECFRILKPGGKLVIMEPSKHHFRKNYFQLLKSFNVKALYYRFLANFVHEPYINEWHNIEIKPWLEKHGFKMLTNFNGVPEEKIVAQKPH